MTLASHNSWSFSRPVWWLRPFKWIGRCQSLDIVRQYDYGVRLYDLRLRFDKDGKPYLCHGLMRYEGDPMADLHRLAIRSNSRDRIYVRVMLEDLPWTKNADYPLFAEFCYMLTERFRSLVFFGGNSRRCWHSKFYHFDAMVSYVEKHGSVCSNRIYERLIPWFYAKRMNDINRNACTQEYLMFDFIEI